jgi:hypothetical protein
MSGNATTATKLLSDDAAMTYLSSPLLPVVHDSISQRSRLC